jgi:hypothetical protein
MGKIVALFSIGVVTLPWVVLLLFRLGEIADNNVTRKMK